MRTDVNVSIEFDPINTRFGVMVDGHQLIKCIPGTLGERTMPSASVPDINVVEHYQRLVAAKKTAIVEVMECNNCGRFGLAIDDVRITDHKCSGAWEIRVSKMRRLPAALVKTWLVAAKAQHAHYVAIHVAREKQFGIHTRAFMKCVTGFSAETVQKAIKSLIQDNGARAELNHRFAEKEYRTKSGLAKLYGYANCGYPSLEFIRGIELERLSRMLPRVARTLGQSRAA